MRKALFYFQNPSHPQFLLPVFRFMKKLGDWDIAFCIPRYDPGTGTGFPPEEMTKIKAIHHQFVRNPSEWNPNVTIVASNPGPGVASAEKIVNLGHGLISKGTQYTSRSIISADNLIDLHCVPGEAHKRKLEQNPRFHAPIVVTGYPKLDPLFQHNLAPAKVLKERMGLPPGLPVALYAPSHEMELSAIPILWTRIRNLASANLQLLIKIPELASEEWKNAHKQLTETNPNIVFIADPDLVPYMQMADVLITDTNTAAFEFVSIDKPVVLFDNPNRKEYHGFHPNDIEYSYPDVGIHVNTFEQLVDAVHRSIQHPAEFHDNRMRIVNDLLSYRDGKSTQRVVDAICDLLDEKYRYSGINNDKTLVIVNCSGDTESILTTLHSIARDRSTNVQVVILGDISASIHDEIETKSALPVMFANSILDIDEESLRNADYLARIQPGMIAYNKWIYRLLNHLRTDPSLEGIAPLALNGAPVQDPTQRLTLQLPHQADTEQVDAVASFSFAGEAFAALSSPRPDVWIVRNGAQSAIALLDIVSKDAPFPRSLLHLTEIAKDVVTVFQPLIAFDMASDVDILDNSQREQAEKRINELTEWIGCILEPVRNRDKKIPAEIVDMKPATPQKDDPHTRLAEHYFKRGKLDLAVKHVEKALEVNPDDAALIELARKLGIKR